MSVWQPATDSDSLERKKSMSKISKTIHDIHYMDQMAERDIWINRMAPLSKLLVTFLYLILVMSIPKEDLSRLLSMGLYLVILVITAELPLKRTLYQLRYVLMMVLLLGVVNPLLDRQVVTVIGGVAITSGMISMVSLVLKASFAVFASFILIETTSIENLCYAMRRIHVPKMLVTLIMLIYRYIILMLKETERITQAYAMRAPGQKGIAANAWGSLIGGMLLRTMDKAELVYESMTLRGFNGEFYLRGQQDKRINSVLYFVVWTMILLLLRVFPVFEIVGEML